VERFDSVAEFRRWARGRYEADNRSRALIAWILIYARSEIRNAIVEALAFSLAGQPFPEERDESELPEVSAADAERYRRRVERLMRALPGYWNIEADESD
jgi:glutathione S-transferase